MVDHVAVLREIRNHYADTPWVRPDKREALDHAIAAVAERDALVARLGALPKFTPMSSCMVADRKGEWISADDLARVVKENE